MARLIIIKGPDEGQQIDLTENSITLGRDRTNVIPLHDTEVSRRHAEIAPLPGGIWEIRDLNSANGTLVNTRPIKQLRLTPGDHIQLGQSIIVFSAGRTERIPSSELADQIRMVSRQDFKLSSAIVRTIADNAGSQILAQPEKVGTQWLKSRLANLSLMYDTITAVSNILDLDQLLDKIMELIFASIEADHGCIMLRNPDDGSFEPKAIRYREGVNRQEKMTVSRTIMDYVLKEKQGVLVTDASRDDRFSSGQSITRFNLQEVVCVPMKGRHETLGVLFLDTLSNNRDIVASGREDGSGKFSEDHLSLTIAIAHQAALAVEDTYYHHALVQSERLAAVGQTIAALSHHIKNIMQGIVFGSDMVRSGIATKDEAILLKGWKMVERNQGKIHELVLDMLSYSKDREPAAEATDLNALIADVMEVVQGRIEELNIRAEVRPNVSLPSVPCDPDGIHRALLNIISNALDALEDRPDPYIGIQTLLESGGEWVRIVILDHGSGIPPDKLDEIFRPFVSTKGAKGTGLGLAVSQKIIREHGGEISVQSQVGKGSKFVIRLPMQSPLSLEGSNSGTQEFPSMPSQF